MSRLIRTRSFVIAASTVGVVLVVFYVFVSYQMASGVTVAERKPIESTPASLGLAYEDVQFPPRGEDVTLRGWLLPAEGDGPAIIFVHGLDGNREGDLDVAARFVELGYDALVFDLRGHGESDDATISGGFYERRDVHGAFDYLVSRGYDPAEIGVIGFSMGAATALISVADEPLIRAVVADSAFADVSDMIAQETAKKTPFPEWMVPLFIPGMDAAAKVFYGIDIDEIVPEDAAARIDYPLLVIHGEDDTRIDPQHGVRIHGKSNQLSDLWLVPGTEHTKAFENFPDQFIEKTSAYFESRFGALP